MNRDKFFAAIEETLFHPLSQSQVDGINAILDAWEHTAPNSDPRFIAYSLATTYHETARTMQPIREIGRGHGRAYGVPVGPWHQIYYGRGDVQETWLRNYQFANAKLHALGLLKDSEDLVKTPDLALRTDVAAAIMIHGMLDGWFTGRKLGHFFFGSRSDPIDARTIINGHDKATLVASYYHGFLHGLQAAAGATRDVAA
jgi:putative chitinase